jgi:copper chaperone CopZ
MERLKFQVPELYADHQVALVREKLGSLPGVVGVWVSPGFSLVTVETDTEQAPASLIEKALGELGLKGEGEMVAPPPSDKSDPAWYQVGSRSTKTNPQEVTMSGEFRKY